MSTRRPGEVLGDTAEVADPKTGEKNQVKTCYVWDTATNSAATHDKAAKPALSGTFTVDGKTYITEFDLLKERMAEYTLDWASEMSSVPAETIAQIAEEYAKGPSIIAFLAISIYTLFSKSKKETAHLRGVVWACLALIVVQCFVFPYGTEGRLLQVFEYVEGAVVVGLLSSPRYQKPGLRGQLSVRARGTLRSLPSCQRRTQAARP